MNLVTVRNSATLQLQTSDIVNVQIISIGTNHRMEKQLPTSGSVSPESNFAFDGNEHQLSSSTGGATMTFTCPVAFPAGVKLEAKVIKMAEVLIGSL